MDEQIYFICQESNPSFVHIDYTSDLTKKINAYINKLSHFDNLSHKIWSLSLVKSEYTCCEVYYIINKICEKTDRPFKKYSNENYYLNSFDDLFVLLDRLNIKYKFEKVDVCKLKNEAIKYNVIDAQKIKAHDLEVRKNIHLEKLRKLLLNISIVL